MRPPDEDASRGHQNDLSSRNARVRGLIASALVAFSAAAAAGQEVLNGQGWQIAGAFPQSEPGPLERRAKPITPENPIPRRTRLVRPPYPTEAAVVGVRATVTLRVTVDHLGTVGEVRTVGVPVLGAIPPGTLGEERAFTAALLGLVRSAKDAVGQWVYEPPGDAPIAFDVAIAFTPEQDGEVVAQATGRASSATSDTPQGAPATKVKHVTPVYPSAAREAKISGIVSLEVHVGADGRVLEARVVRSIPELDEAALEAVKQWEYTPRRIDGEPMPVTMTVTIQFSLQ
jgi:protein TonB